MVNHLAQYAFSGWWPKVTVYDPSLLPAKSDCVSTKQCVTRFSFARQQGRGWSVSPPTWNPYRANHFQNAAMRWMIQNAATLPMAYGGTCQTHEGCDTPMRRVTCRASPMTAKTDAMKSSCPISTPTLKKSSATGIADCGRPTSLNALAKPKPCNKPKVNATTHGNRSVRPGPALPAVHDFRRHKHDAQRDDGFDWRPRHMHESERRAPRALGCVRG